VINEDTRAEVEQDMRDGLEVGIRGTPTLMVNGELLVGVQSEAALTSVLEKAGLVID
jgi:protein-disulfide isomerase